LSIWNHTHKINLLPPRLRVAASAEQGWGWGKFIDFQAIWVTLFMIADSHINLLLPHFIYIDFI